MIVLLSGWSGAGKDAAAALLVDEMNFVRLAFADALKMIVSKAMDIPLNYFHDRELKDEIVPGYHLTPRQLLLDHAREARVSDPDIYSRQIVENIRRYPDRYVISDWRYRREYEFLKTELPGIRILRTRIVRPTVIPSADLTEHDLDNEKFDFTINNEGSISDLRDALRGCLRTL